MDEEELNFTIHIFYERSIEISEINDSDLFWVEDKNTNTEPNFLNYLRDVTGNDVLTIYDSTEPIGKKRSVTSHSLICNADQDDSSRYFFQECLQHIWSEDYFYDKYLRVWHDVPIQNVNWSCQSNTCQSDNSTCQLSESSKFTKFHETKF